MNTQVVLRYLLIPVVTLHLHCYGQGQSEIDSLVNLTSRQQDDSNKVLVYDRLAYLYNFSRYETDIARKYVDSARALSERINYQKGLMGSHYGYGMVDMNENKYKEALYHFNIYINHQIARGDSLKVARGLYCVGTIYNNLDEYDKNLAIQLRILKIYEAANNTLSMAHTLGSIAGVYWKTGNNQQAMETYRRSNEIYRSLGEQRRYGMGLQNLANVYVTRNSFDSARMYYTQALEIIREFGSDAEAAYILANLGDLHEELKDYGQSLSFNLEALRIRRGLNQRRPLASALLETGHLYLLLKQYGKAEAHLREGLDIAQAIAAKDLLRDAYSDLSQLSLANGDPESAYHYNNLSHQWKDSIFNEEKSRQLIELQTKYETAEKDKRISLLAKENELQAKEAERQKIMKYALAGGLILLTIVGGLIFYTFRQRSKNEKMLALKNEQLKDINFRHQLSELEMRALRAQINPHFLFNCMNSINRMILQGETEDASRYLTKFSTLVRLILENAEKANVSLQDELRLVESYIQLEALRLKGKIGFNISVSESIEKENTYLPSMVLQPFVENAIWHGLIHKGKNEQGMINIDIREENDRLLCTIEDNGVGRERARQLQDRSVFKNKSMGLKITEERLKLLSREQLEQLVRITDLKDSSNQALGTRVEINIPVS